MNLPEYSTAYGFKVVHCSAIAIIALPIAPPYTNYNIIKVKNKASSLS